MLTNIIGFYIIQDRSRRYILHWRRLVVTWY